MAVDDANPDSVWRYIQALNQQGVLIQGWVCNYPPKMVQQKSRKFSMIKVKEDSIMKKMTEHQIVAILKEAEAGIPVKELCRKYGMGNSTFYKWREKYGGIEISDIKRLKELEAENRKLKQMFAELSLKSQLQEEIIKKF
jgi:putative transposase